MPYADRKKYKECQRKDAAKRRLVRRRMAVDYLGGRCELCGITEEQEPLQFDHVPERGPKFRNVTRLLSAAWEILKAELDKCQLLCMECHYEVTWERRARPYRGDEDEAIPF